MFIFPSGTAGYTINRSLRFRSSASAYLSRTISTTSNRQTWTWSGWVKRGDVSGAIAMTLFGVASQGGSSGVFTQISFNASGTPYSQIDITSFNNTVVEGRKSSSMLLRDPSSWYHIVGVFDTTNATAADRIRLYVNGTRVSSFAISTDPSLNYNGYINSNSYRQVIGALDYTGSASDNKIDGYLAEINFIDGQALTPSSFGYTDSYGVWKPKAYTGTYGTNGFYLPFNDGTSTTTLGYDRSGNSNNWTATNVSLTAGSTYDWMLDTPSVNYAVMNPLDSSSASNTVSGANLNATITSSASLRGSIYVSTGKWYYEVTVNTLQNLYLGLASNAGRPTNYTATSAFGVNNVGDFYEDNTLQTEDSIALAAGAVYGIAFDATAKRFWIAKDGQWYSCDRTPDITISASDIESGNFGYDFSTLTGDLFSPHFGNSTNAGAAVSVNFGQRPFTYTPPTGFKALNTANLPVPSIRNPRQYFDVNTWAGNSSSQSISLQFQPDFVWIKNRSSASFDNNLHDALRAGGQNVLYSNNTNAEVTDSTQVSSFSSGGYNLGASSQTNGSTFNYVGWAWKGAGSGFVTNTAGSITSTVSANTTSGFSIVTYTGTGANATVGHGLGVAPRMVIVKNRSVVDGWAVYHVGQNASPATGYTALNETSAFAATISPWNNTAPTSTVFSVGTSSRTNGNTNNHVAYCFAEVAGFSKFGSYTGNGSADGPFIYFGFRARYILYKRYEAASSGNWNIIDTARDTYNPEQTLLRTNLSNADETNSVYAQDITANGWKIRSTNVDVNASGASYIFAAFAEFPFSMSLAR